MNKQFPKQQLDAEEQELNDSLERGEWRSVTNRMVDHTVIINTFIKTKCLKCKTEEVIRDEKYYPIISSNSVHFDVCEKPNFVAFRQFVVIGENAYALLEFDEKLNCINCADKLSISLKTEIYDDD